MLATDPVSDGSFTFRPGPVIEFRSSVEEPVNCSRKTQRSVPIKDGGVNVLKACDNSDAPNFFAGLERTRLVGNGS